MKLHFPSLPSLNVGGRRCLVVLVVVESPKGIYFGNRVSLSDRNGFLFICPKLQKLTPLNYSPPAAI